MNINIKDKNKAEVLSKLFNASKPQGMGFLQPHNDPMEIEEAQNLIDEGILYFDYIRGRVMKIDLSSDELNTTLYDRDNGEGAGELALA